MQSSTGHFPDSLSARCLWQEFLPALPFAPFLADIPTSAETCALFRGSVRIPAPPPGCDLGGFYARPPFPSLLQLSIRSISTLISPHPLSETFPYFSAFQHTIAPELRSCQFSAAARRLRMGALGWRMDINTKTLTCPTLFFPCFQPPGSGAGPTNSHDPIDEWLNLVHDTAPYLPPPLIPKSRFEPKKKQALAAVNAFCDRSELCYQLELSGVRLPALGSQDINPYDIIQDRKGSPYFHTSHVDPAHPNSPILDGQLGPFRRKLVSPVANVGDRLDIG